MEFFESFRRKGGNKVGRENEIERKLRIIDEEKRRGVYAPWASGGVGDERTEAACRADLERSGKQGKERSRTRRNLGVAGAAALGLAIACAPEGDGQDEHAKAHEKKQNNPPVTQEIQKERGMDGLKNSQFDNVRSEEPVFEEPDVVLEGSDEEQDTLPESEIGVQSLSLEREQVFLRETVADQMKQFHIEFPEAISDLIEELRGYGIMDISDLLSEDKLPGCFVKKEEEDATVYTYTSKNGNKVEMRVEKHDGVPTQRRLVIKDRFGMDGGEISVDSGYGKLNFKMRSPAGEGGGPTMDDFYIEEGRTYFSKKRLENQADGSGVFTYTDYDSSLHKPTGEVISEESIPAAMGDRGAPIQPISSIIKGNSKEGYVINLRYRGAVAEGTDAEGGDKKREVVVSFPNIKVVPVAQATNSNGLLRYSVQVGDKEVILIKDPNVLGLYSTQYEEGADVQGFPPVEVLYTAIADKF